MKLSNMFKPKRRFLTDELAWLGILSRRGRRRIVHLDHGAWMMVVEFRGLDMDCRDLEDRFRLPMRFNAALLQFDKGFAFWIDEQHIPVTDYPETADGAALAARIFEA